MVRHVAAAATISKNSLSRLRLATAAWLVVVAIVVVEVAELLISSFLPPRQTIFPFWVSVCLCLSVCLSAVIFYCPSSVSLLF